MVYAPSRLPSINNLEELRQLVEEEFERIAKELNETPVLQLVPLYREPERPRDGMILYADGTSWDPGAGEGVYARENGAWVKL